MITRPLATVNLLSAIFATFRLPNVVDRSVTPACPPGSSAALTVVAALAVVAVVLPDVYAPVDGTIVGITPYGVGGHRYGARIDIQPQSAPSIVVSLTQLRADPSLSLGANVVSAATRLGAVVDLAKVERQALARYTNDEGNHVSVELRPAASLVLN